MYHLPVPVSYGAAALILKVPPGRNQRSLVRGGSDVASSGAAAVPPDFFLRMQCGYAPELMITSERRSWQSDFAVMWTAGESSIEG